MLDLIKKNINLRSGIILLSLAIFFVFITNSFKKNKSKDISDFVVQVEKGILSDSINTSGEVKAIRTSNIGPRKQGVIKEIKVDEGDLVKKDQVLASLDDEDFIYKIEELELNVEKQKSEFLRREYLYQALLAKEARLESAITNAFGRALAYQQTANQRQFLAANASAREALGVPASYGAPVMLPPTNRLGGALQIAGQVAGIYSAFKPG